MKVAKQIAPKLWIFALLMFMPDQTDATVSEPPQRTANRKQTVMLARICETEIACIPISCSENKCYTSRDATSRRNL